MRNFILLIFILVSISTGVAGNSITEDNETSHLSSIIARVDSYFESTDTKLISKQYHDSGKTFSELSAIAKTEIISLTEFNFADGKIMLFEAKTDVDELVAGRLKNTLPSNAPTIYLCEQNIVLAITHPELSELVSISSYLVNSLPLKEIAKGIRSGAEIKSIKTASSEELSRLSNKLGYEAKEIIWTQWMANSVHLRINFLEPKSDQSIPWDDIVAKMSKLISPVRLLIKDKVFIEVVGDPANTEADYKLAKSLFEK
jgi:hypothetical protein